MADIIAAKSNLDQDAIADLFREQTTLDATRAKDNGIVEDVRNFEVPPGAPVVSLVFQR